MNYKLLLMTLLFILAVGVVSASVVGPPTGVSGTIYDQNHATVAGATVIVKCENIVQPSVQSLSDGSYVVEIPPGQCDYSQGVVVTASKDNMEGTATGDTCAVGQCIVPVALIDVTIPEFGIVGALIALLIVVGLIAYRRR